MFDTLAMEPAWGRMVDSLDHQDALVCALGYEERSRLVAERFGELATTRLASAFPGRPRGDYDRNRGVLTDLDFALREHNAPGDLRADMLALVTSSDPGEIYRVTLDISSLSRDRLAASMLGIASGVLSGRPVLLTCLYAPCVFTPPDPPLDSRIVSAGPVAPELTGAVDDLSLPITMAIGLGYERDRAIGAAELLEADKVWGFIPQGYDPRFDEAVMEVNRPLFSGLVGANHVPYRLNRPLELWATLSAALTGDGRAVILPLGPKLFAAVSMLFAMEWWPQVAVWRVSGERDDQISDPPPRLPTGDIIGLQVLLRHR